MHGIQTADAVFVWLGGDFASAHGTLAEIGYAYSLEKNIVLAVPPDLQSETELWFIALMATSIVVAGTAKQAFDSYLVELDNLQ